MAQWWSIEVFSGEKLPASGWRFAHEDDLTEAAITHGALYYEWHHGEYGVIFEVLFGDDEQWDAFRALPAVRAALDAVPDPVNGLLVYRGRGGTSGARKPRKPGPAPGAAALELSEPRQPRRLRLISGAAGGDLRRELADPYSDEADPDELDPDEFDPDEPDPVNPGRPRAATAERRGR